MSDMLTCFDDKFSCDTNMFPTKVIAPSVLRAVGIVNKWIYNREAALEIFRNLALDIVPNIDDDELDGVISNAIREGGVDVQFDSMTNKLMQIAVVPNAVVKTLKRHVIFFNTKLVTVQSLATESILNDRQEFLHVVKLIHEYSHALSPHLFALAKSRYSSLPSEVKPITTPDRYGVLAPGKEDMGSHWEEKTFGGRIIPQNRFRWLSPFHQPLQLKVRPDSKFPPHDEYNIRLQDISDEFIGSFLQCCRTWNEGQSLPFGSISAIELHTAVDKVAPLRLTELFQEEGRLSTISRDDEEEGTRSPSRRKRRHRSSQ